MARPKRWRATLFGLFAACGDSTSSSGTSGAETSSTMSATTSTTASTSSSTGATSSASSSDASESGATSSSSDDDTGASTTTGAVDPCGDGVLDRGEDCDEGRANGDGESACSPSCTLNVCGDAYEHRSEECDDGNDDIGDGCSPTCVDEISELALGEMHTCARMGPRVRCWGSGFDGRLGYGNSDHIGDDELPSSAGDVPIGGDAIQITAGSNHTCALLDGGGVRCWGQWGALGYGNTENIGDDEDAGSGGDVELGGVAVHVEAGDGATCAILDDGALRCWGSWAYFGVPGDIDVPTAVDVTSSCAAPFMCSAEEDMLAIDLASRGDLGDHACALMADGGVRCWGDDVCAAGYASGSNCAGPGVCGDVEIGGSVAAVRCGREFNCALLDDATVRCWGLDRFGDGVLGHGNTDDTCADGPSQSGIVELDDDAVQISSGEFHTCARTSLDELRCWGYGEFGQLGNGTGQNIGDTETPAEADAVDVGDEVGHVAAGDWHTCVITRSGTVRCWGQGDYGRLGYGDVENVGDNEIPAAVGDVSVF